MKKAKSPDGIRSFTCSTLNLTDGRRSKRWAFLTLTIQLEERCNISRQSDFIEPGNEILKPFDSVIGKIGEAICFDLRFPEIALSLKRQGADIILFPSAFTVPTGKAHWTSLLRARAIECQTYVRSFTRIRLSFRCD